jgi:hypothetical protein
LCPYNQGRTQGVYYYRSAYKAGEIVSGFDESRGVTYLYVCKRAAPARSDPGMDMEDTWFFLGAVGERHQLVSSDSGDASWRPTNVSR